jgi:hypothetical protein
MDGVRDRRLTVHLADFVGEYNLRPGACAMNADTIPVYSEDGERWTHFPAMQWDDERKEATLRFESRADSIWIAHVTPYPLKRLERLIAELRGRDFVEIEVMGQSVRGRDLHLITVTDRRSTRKRKCVWLIAREHAWETGTSYVLEGALRFLTSDDPQARVLRDRVLLRFVPTMDPDGLVLGHVRFNASGYDLNRHWPEVDPRSQVARERMPEIWAVKKALFAHLDRGERIDLLLNLHNTETAEYLETEAQDDLTGARLKRLQAALIERGSFGPSREPGVARAPSDTTNSLWHERGVPAVLMEQRIGTSRKLGRRPTVADRLEFGRRLVIELGDVLLSEESGH